MICGKCQSKKSRILLTQTYQLNQGLLLVKHIPATQCNCETYIANSVLQEITSYIEENPTMTGQVAVSYTEV